MLGHVIFLGLFFTVVAIVVATVSVSLFRSARDFRSHRTDAIAWQTTFPDLPQAERVCRHVFSGEFKGRTCDKAFDCRACQTHAALVAKRPLDPVPGNAEPRFFHRGHAWVHPESDGTVTVGLDPLGASLVAQPDATELPAIGERLQVNGTAWHIRKRGADVRILSPLDGEVVATGGAQHGWYLKVKPAGGYLDTRHLLHGPEVQPWMTREMDRLQATLAPAGQALTMADGGMPVDDIAATHPEADWDAVCSKIFLQP